MVAMMDEGGGEGRRAGDGEGDKTEGETGTAAASKGRYHNVVLAFAQSRIKAPLQVNLLYMMKVNPSCNSQFAISDQRSYFFRILASV